MPNKYLNSYPIALFEITSFGNGFAYEILRIADGSTNFLQGDDALQFGDDLNRASSIQVVNDLASVYF